MFGLDNACDMARSALACGGIRDAQVDAFVTFLLDNFRDDSLESVFGLNLDNICATFAQVCAK